VIIVERINPTGRKVLAAEMKNERWTASALTRSRRGWWRAHAGRHAGIPQSTRPPAGRDDQAVMEVSDLPICIDSSIIERSEAGLPHIKARRWSTPSRQKRNG